MSKVVLRQQPIKLFLWHSKRKLLIRQYHLEPGEENLCLVSRSNHELEMEVRTVTHPKENEVLIRMGSCCLSTFDFDFITRLHGRDNRTLNTSLVLGSFATGIVIKPGAGVTEVFSEGDRVALEPGICCNVCKNCLSGKTNLCPSIRYMGSEGLDGSLCRFINHPVAFTHKLSDNVSLEEGTLATMIASCIHSYKRAGIKKNYKILIMGANLIGLIAIMVIKYLGIGSIFVTETSNYRLKQAKSFGADFAIKMTSIHSPEYPEYLNEIISSILSGEPDIIIDTIGTAPSLECSFNLCKSGGRILLMKLMSRPIPAKFYHATLREIDIIGAFSYTHSSFKEAIGLLKNEEITFKKILPVKIPLERALDAFSHGRATIGENIFILVSNYNEKDRVQYEEIVPQTDESQTATIPEQTRLFEHQGTKSSGIENVGKKENQEGQGNIMESTKNKAPPLSDSQFKTEENSNVEIKKHAFQMQQKKIESESNKGNTIEKTAGTIAAKDLSEQKIATKKDPDEQKTGTKAAKEVLSEEKKQNIATKKDPDEQKTGTMAVKEVLSEEKKQNIAIKKDPDEQKKTGTIATKEVLSEEKKQNIATKKDPEEGPIMQKVGMETNSGEIKEGITTEGERVVEKELHKNKQTADLNKEKTIDTTDKTKLKADDKKSAKEDLGYKIEANQNKEKERKSITKNEEKINSEKSNNHTKTELNDTGKVKKDKSGK